MKNEYFHETYTPTARSLALAREEEAEAMERIKNEQCEPELCGQPCHRCEHNEEAKTKC